MAIREPAVAGMFYEANPADLRREVEQCFLGPGGPGSLPQVSPRGPRKIVGIVSPHAGFMYSGGTAAYGYHRLAEDGVPDVAVLLGPNHRGMGSPVAVAGHDAWHTPMGEVTVDRETASQIASASGPAQVDALAHRLEHSLEVQLPFMQYIAPGAAVIPILVGILAWENGALRTAQDLGAAIGAALKGKNAIVVASTDFTHYESQDSAKRKDSEAIRCILELDEAALLRTVRQLDISMCGVMPTAIALTACKAMGAVSARCLAYRTSGDVTGDYSQVVGYASVEIDR